MLFDGTAKEFFMWLIRGTTIGSGLSATGDYPLGIFSTITKLDINGVGLWLRRISTSTGVGGIGDVELLPDYTLAALGAFNGKAKYGLDSIVAPPGPDRSTLFVNIATASNLINNCMVVVANWEEW